MQSALKAFVVAGVFVLSVFIAPTYALAAPCPGGGTAPDGFACPAQPPSSPGSSQRIDASASDKTLIWQSCGTADCGSERARGIAVSNGWYAQSCASQLRWNCDPVVVVPTAPNAPTGRATTAPRNENLSQLAKDLDKECGGTNGRVDDWSLGENVCYGFHYAMRSMISLEFVFRVIGWFTWIFFKLGQVTLGFALWWLDGAVFYTVLLMGVYISGPFAIDGIAEAWAVIRDLANVFIIGGFLVVGISTILQVAEYSANRFLSRLIIAALLVNFSFFFAGAAIDAANYISVKIYTSDFFQKGCVKQTASISSMVGLPTAGLRGLDTLLREGNFSTGVCSVGASFMKHTKMSSWTDLRDMSLALSGLNAQGGNSESIDWTQVNQQLAGRSAAEQGEIRKNLEWNMMILALLGFIFTMLTAFVFFQIGFALIVRFVTLIFLLVTSPFGIAGISIPYVDKYAGQWWSMFASQALFAPIFFVLLGVGLTVIKGLSERLVVDGATFGAAATTVSHQAGQGWLVGSLGLYITFLISIAFIFMAYMLSKQMAESVQEFKGLYGMASKSAMNSFMSPWRMVFGMKTFGGLGLLSPVRGALNWVADRGREGGWVDTGFRGASSLLRMPSTIGHPSKEGDKSVWQEDEERAKARREGRGLSGVLGRSGLSKGGSLLKPGGRSKGDTKKIKDALRAIKNEDIRGSMTTGEIEMALEQGLFSPEQEAFLFSSNAFSSSEKARFRNAILKRFNQARTDKKSWADIANEYDDLTPAGREQAHIADPTLASNPGFLGAMKSPNFENEIKDKTNEEKTEARRLRREGQGAALADARKIKDPEARRRAMRTILDRMSNDEKKDMTPEMIVDTEGELTVEEVLHIYRNGGDARQAVLMRNPKYRKAIEDSQTGRGGTGGRATGGTDAGTGSTNTASAGAAPSANIDNNVDQALRDTRPPPPRPGDNREDTDVVGILGGARAAPQARGGLFGQLRRSLGAPLGSAPQPPTPTPQPPTSAPAPEPPKSPEPLIGDAPTGGDKGPEGDVTPGTDGKTN